MEVPVIFTRIPSRSAKARLTEARHHHALLPTKKRFTYSQLQLPIVGAGTILIAVQLPAATPFFSGAAISALGIFAATIAFLIGCVINSPRQGGNPLIVMGIFVITLLAIILNYVTDERSRALETNCAALQVDMTVGNPKASDAAAIFSAYGCRPRFGKTA